MKKSIFLFFAAILCAIGMNAANYLYLKPSSDWKNDNARFAAYFFESGEKWVSMTKVTDDLYRVEIPSGYSKVIFCRMNGSNSTNNWDNKWNQTGNLTINGNTGKVYNIKGWGDGSSWGSTVPLYAKNTTLYILPNSDWKSNNARFAVCFLDGKENWVSCTKVGSTDYYSVTVPNSDLIAYAIFCRMNGDNATNNWSNKWNQTSDLAPSSGKNGVEITGWDNKQEWIVVYDQLSVNHTPTTAADAPNINQTLIKDGSSVTVTAPNAKTGYHWVKWTSSNGSFNDQSAQNTNFTPTAKSAVATANYAENTYTVTISAGTGGTVSPSGSQTIGQVTQTTVTATANDNYEFANWTATGGVIVANNSAASTTITATATGTLTANFRSTATYSLTVAEGAGIASVEGSTDPVTLGNTYEIKATPKTGYTFSTWTANPAENATFGSATTAETTVTVNNGSVTVTASATENMSTLTTSNKYDAGDPDYAVPSVNAPQIGIATTATVTATTAGNGYTFTGWTLTNCTRTDGGVADATSITVRSNGDGKAATVTANYEEDLSSNWHLVGKNNAFPDEWNITEASMMKKLSGRSTEKVVYMTLNVQNLETHEFKVVDDNGSSGDIWYGYSSGNTYQIWDKTATKKVYSGDGNSNNLKFTPTIKGEYEFKVDYSGTYPDVTITYPEIPVVAVKLAGTMTGWETPAAFTINGTTATLTLTLTQGYYQFKMIETTLVDAKEKDNWYGNGGTMTRKNCTNWTFDSDANATIFADADGAYTFEWDITTDKLSVTNMPAFPDLSNQPTTLYFRPSTNWKENNPKYAAYFCYGDKTTEDKWVELTPDNGIYKVDNSDKQYVMVIFVRLKSGGALSWDDKWGQTDNLIIPNTPNNLNTCFAFWKNAWDDVSGLWVAPTPLTDTNWSAFIAAYNGKTINAVVERSFTSGQYHTLCLPFDIPTNWLGEGTEAYQLTSIVANNTGDKLSLNATKWETIVAGQPYIIVPVKGSEYEHVIINGVTVKNVSAGTSVASGAGYKATLKAVTATDGTQTNGSTEYYVGAKDGKLYNTQTNKLGLRAIIELTTTSGQPLPPKVRAQVTTGENVETGVEDIITTDAPVKVIENGQLIIIRDGVKYNVQGQKL